jgi:hypothetical protein
VFEWRALRQRPDGRRSPLYNMGVTQQLSAVPMRTLLHTAARRIMVPLSYDPSNCVQSRWSGWLVLTLALVGCDAGEDATSDTPTGPATVEQAAVVESGPPALAAPVFANGSCRVYTSEPGWNVFVDGSLVRDAQGEPATTPCLVAALAGSHTVTVAMPGKQDRARDVLFADETELVFETENVPDGESALLTAPWLDAPVREPIALSELNSPGREFDPFLSRDGRSIWFAADRAEGRGIYVATRLTPLHPFGAPELLRLTSSVDQPASPSVNAAADAIVYAIPSKGRLRALTRENPLAPFEDPKILLSDDDLETRYPAAQILSAGDRIYFSREASQSQETRVVFRAGGPELNFENVRVVEFPGLHPRLSSDGLRQFLFDGQRVQRARRLKISDPFAAPELVAEVEFAGYRPAAAYRQFFVTDDEQWLVYSDDPAAAADLWIVRLSDGPAWGVPIRGTSIEPRAIAAEEEMPVEEELFIPEEVPVEEEPPPDPRAQPLPYVAFREELLALMSRRDFDAALELIDAAQGDLALRPASELLGWDQQDLQQVIQFWADVESGVASLQPGDKLRIGSANVEFEKFAEGVITAKARSSTIEKPLVELDAAVLVSLAEKVLDLEQPAEALRPLVFLEYAGDGTSSRRDALLTASGALGAEFQEHIAARELALAEQELARENISAALARLAVLEQSYSTSAAASRADALREALYVRTQWQMRGGRTWRTGPSGEFAADAGRVDNAILISPTMLEDFTLSLEYRTTAANGQGGIHFKYSGEGRLDVDPLKIQLSNDAGVKPDRFSTGALFSRNAPTVNATKPEGEWNTLELTVIGNRLTLHINGQRVLNTSFLLGEHPESGYLALDGIGGGISYRKIILSDQPVRATP